MTFYYGEVSASLVRYINEQMSHVTKWPKPEQLGYIKKTKKAFKHITIKNK